MARSANKKSPYRIGLLGGTFNPVHLGHIKLAQEIFKKLKLDRIIFIPAYIPPHKSSEDIISWQDRYRMAQLAIEGKKNFEVSSIEIRLRGTSYSINTVKELKALYGDTAEIYFITGSDSAGELGSWKDIEDLKKLCKFVIATRPGYNVRSTPPGTMIIEVDTPDISSSDIRRRIKLKRPYADLLPKKVYNHIILRKLYL